MKKFIAVLLMLVMICMTMCVNVGAVTTPKTFALYYGYPSCTNGLYDNELVAQLFAKYDIVVFGDGLELSSHPDNANTIAIISRMKQINSDIEIFGYVPLGIGEYSQSLTNAEIKTRIYAWKDCGATGIFLDEFGYDYKVTRTRQNKAITYARNKKMNVIANSWNYEWCFSKENLYLDWIDFYGNPNKTSTKLNSNDYILFENMYCQVDENGNYLQSADRTLSVFKYYAEIKPQIGKSYYAKFGTKTIALDGISSEWANGRDMYDIAYNTSGLINLYSYGASTRYWGAGCDFVDYLP